MLKRLVHIFWVTLFSLVFTAYPSYEELQAHPFQGTHAHSSIWPTLSDGFTLNANWRAPEVKKQIRWFRHEQDYLIELTRNSRPYIYYVLAETKARHMPAEIALLPMVESNYHPMEVSNSGAAGLWQMMPDTASGFGIKINHSYDGRRDVLPSTKAALHYIAYLHRYFGGSWLLAMAAYDSGEGTVETAILHNRRLHRPTDFWDLPLPKETKLYVPKILALSAIIDHPQKYHLHLYPVNDQPYFKTVTLHRKMALSQVAKMTKTSEKEVRKLNAGVRKNATTPNTSYALLLPAEKADAFNQKNPPAITTAQKTTPHKHRNKHKHWFVYTVPHKESLLAVAEHEQVSSKNLIHWNHLPHPTHIYRGEKLWIYR